MQLKQKINIALINKEEYGWIGRTRLAGKCFDSVVRLLSGVFQYFMYIYVESVEVFLCFVFFRYDLLFYGYNETISFALSVQLDSQLKS